MASESRPTVLLLRSPSNPDPYVAIFSGMGWDARCVSALRFVFPYQEALQQRLASPSTYGGLVLTSPRGVEAIRRVSEQHPTILSGWREKQAYAVGPKTAAELRKLGFNPEGEEAGGATDLLSVIAKKKHPKPLLFPCSNRRRDTIPDGLAEANIPYEEIVVYETHPREDLELDADSVTWVVVFSPSGMEALQHAGPEVLQRVRIAAIGPTTAQAIRETGYPVEAVAEQPAPESLASALQAAHD